MKGLEEQAPSARAILFEAMVDLKMFMLKFSEDHEDAIRRVRDSMILQKVRQAKASGWAGFDLFGLDPKELLDDETQIKTRYSAHEVNAMRNNGFSGLNFKERADKVESLKHTTSYTATSHATFIQQTMSSTLEC
jgi:hypothetical protein